MNIGEVIKDHRWRQRYTIREMADTIGISKATLRGQDRADCEDSLYMFLRSG